MQVLQSHGLRCALQQSSSVTYVSVRNISLTSAISRGIRKGTGSLDRIGTTRRNPESRSNPAERGTRPPRSRFDIERSERAVRTTRFHKERWRKEKESQDVSYEAPLGVPYTTAGSEFLYGTFSVKAALEASRRQIYKLYIWKGDESSSDPIDAAVIRQAKRRGLDIRNVAGSWDKMLMKMSGQRPHNGYVLEAGPVPKLPITSLGKMENPSDSITVATGSLSVEKRTENKIFQLTDEPSAKIPRSLQNNRYPLLLWLDRVTDTGNLGAIIRTAYFFGIDAIIVPDHGTAPFGPVTVKASAGTAEYMPILTVHKELDFVKSSQKQGWKFFAAVAPDSDSARRASKQQGSQDVSEALIKLPCVLMVGNEGEGLRSFMQNAADEHISIEGARRKNEVVDSLNVSVAAALLIARFAPSG